MKPIRYILQSYFQQGFIQVMMIFMSWFLLLLGSLELLKSNHNIPGVHVMFFLAAGMLITGVVALYLGEVTSSDASALIPGFRQRQLVAAGILLSPAVIVPLIVLSVTGLPVLNLLALLLLIMSLLIAYSGNNVQQIGLHLLMLVPLWIVYELLGIEPNFKFIGSFSQLTGLGSNNPFALLIIALALAIAVRFALRFLEGDTKEIKNPEPSGFDIITATHDNIDKITCKQVNRKMRRLFYELKNRRHTYSSYVRLYQYALFNPRYSLIFEPEILVAVIFYITFYVLYTMGTNINSIRMNAPILFLIYQMMASAFTTDFLRHRDRLPMLWLQSQLPARREITKTILFTYLAVGGKQYLKTSLMLILIPLIIPEYFRLEFLLVLAVGILPFIVQIALSLIFSDRISSYSCWGWSVFNMLASFVTIIITSVICHKLKSLLPYLLLFLALVVLSVILIWHANRKWSDTEMNFISPEVML